MEHEEAHEGADSLGVGLKALYVRTSLRLYWVPEAFPTRSKQREYQGASLDVFCSLKLSNSTCQVLML